MILETPAPVMFMGTETLQRISSEALLLSETDRAELAHTLIKSLDAPADADVVEAWDREIQRRLAEIDAGTAVIIDRDEFTRMAQARIADIAKSKAT
jgi:hypothetical protein